MKRLLDAMKNKNNDDTNLTRINELKDIHKITLYEAYGWHTANWSFINNKGKVKIILN